MLKTKNNIEFFNETYYSYKKDENAKILVKKKISIFDNKISNVFYLFDDKIQAEGWYKNAKPLLNKNTKISLKKIYEYYKNDDKKNNKPFLNYMIEEYDDANPIYLKLNDKEKIKYISFLVKKPESITIYDYYENKKSNCLQELFNAVGIDCYFKKNEKKWFVIPLYLNTIVFKTKNNKPYYERTKTYCDMLKKQNLQKSEYKFTCKNGQTFVNKKTKCIFYYSSYRISDKKIEIKPIDYSSSKRIFKTINAFFNKNEICDFDILGNMYYRNVV